MYHAYNCFVSLKSNQEQIYTKTSVTEATQFQIDLTYPIHYEFYRDIHMIVSANDFAPTTDINL